MRWRWWLSIFFAMLCILAIPGVALAHPEIVRTEPAADAQLTTAPTEIRIIFNESVEGAFSDLQLFDAQGQRADVGGAALVPDDPTQLVLPLPTLGPGIYTVVWQTVGSDGHKVIGNFVFTVLGSPTATASGSPGAAPTSPVGPTPLPTPAPVVLPPPPTGPPPTLAAILRALMLLGALISAGGWVTINVVFEYALPADAPAARTLALRRWRRAAWQSLLLLLIAAALFALIQTATVANRLDGASLSAFLFNTRLGQALLLRVVLALVLALLLATTTVLGRWRTILGLLIGGALLLTFSLSGHAAAQPAPLLPVLLDWAHLVATSIWVGGLVTLVLLMPILLGTLQTKERASALAVVIVRFSALALASVITLAISGTYAGLLHMKAVSELWTSEYGLALLFKLILFGVLLALGAYNRLRIQPLFVSWIENMAAAAEMKRWQHHFLRVVRSEVVLAVLAIGAVGFLTNTAPPSAEARRQPTPATAAPSLAVSPPTSAPLPTRTPVPSKPFAETKTVGDLQIGLEVTPAILGKNSFRVSLRDAAGQPVDVQRVVLSLEMQEMDMGVNQIEVTPQGTGEFEAPAGWLSMVGHWQVKVVVRRADADDLETTFLVPVGG